MNSQHSAMIDVASYSCGIVVHARIVLLIEVYPALVVRSGVRPAVSGRVVVVVTFVVPMRCLTVVSRHAARLVDVSSQRYEQTVLGQVLGLMGVISAACALPAARP